LFEESQDIKIKLYRSRLVYQVKKSYVLKIKWQHSLKKEEKLYVYFIDITL